MFFNSTPSAIVQDLQQQADDLTAETDRRCKAYGQLKKERRSVSNQVQELRTQNTHLMQQASGLKMKVTQLEKNSGICDKEDATSCDQERASTRKGLRVRLAASSFQQPERCLPAEEVTAGMAAMPSWALLTSRRVCIDKSGDDDRDDYKSFDEDNDDCKSVQCATPLGSPAQSAPLPFEGAPLHLATLINEACEDVQDALKVKLKLSAAFMRTGQFSPAANSVTGMPAKGTWHFGDANDKAVRAAGKTRGSTSRPAWSSAFTCITAPQPRPQNPPSKQVVTPRPSPTASAGRRPDAASHAAGPASVQSRQAIAKLGPVRRGSTVAATVLSTAGLDQSAEPDTTSSSAAASDSACTAQPSTRQTTRASAATAAGQKASVKPRAAAAQKAPATSRAGEPETVAPRRSARLSKLPSRPATTAGQPGATAVPRKATAGRSQGASGTGSARPAREQLQSGPVLELKGQLLHAQQEQQLEA
ncbi:hypothetical protein ABBQ32_006824 [Trebouxia sp. C0010 RCD-2024]